MAVVSGDKCHCTFVFLSPQSRLPVLMVQYSNPDYLLQYPVYQSRLPTPIQINCPVQQSRIPIQYLNPEYLSSTSIQITCPVQQSRIALQYLNQEYLSSISIQITCPVQQSRIPLQYLKQEYLSSISIQITCPVHQSRLPVQLYPECPAVQPPHPHGTAADRHPLVIVRKYIHI